MFTAIAMLAKTVIGGITQHFQGKQKIKQANIDNRARLAASDREYNHEWEMKQLENAGWKDDFLFYGFLAMFVWAGFDPDGARQFFLNLQVLPEWFIKTWMWIVASVVAVKKVGDYVPSLVKGVKDVFGK